MEHPKDATTRRSRSARPANAVYVDFMQNVVGKSVAAPLSVRARPGALVSTPLGWDELDDDLDPQAFTLDTLTGKELERRGRIWKAAMRHTNRLEVLFEKRPGK
jgi:bifunctional non-homologous end joining protein LigD